MNFARYRKQLRLAAVLGVAFALLYLLWRTLIPGGSLVVTTNLRQPAAFVSSPKPQGRLADPIIDEQARTLSPLVRDPMYLDLAPPSRFDRVRMSVRYVNTGHGQIELGALASGVDEQYITAVVEQRLIDTLPWSRLENDDYVLLQRTRHYDSINEFLQKPPDRTKLATTEGTLAVPVRLTTPAAGPSRTIEVSLRGHHRLITYADGAPMAVSFVLQDMNREVGEDPVVVSVYRLGEREPISTVRLDDDGNTAGDQRSSKLRTISASLPMPAAGAYQIEFTAPGDIFIRKIVTKQTKLVFSGWLYLGDQVGYSDHLRARTIMTTGRSLSAKTAHMESLQTLTFDGNSLTIDEPNTRFIHDLRDKTDGTAIRVPKVDVLLESDGVFALSAADLFDPLPLRLRWDSTLADLNQRGVDYVLARYQAPRSVDGMLEASTEFSFDRLALTKERDYRFVISAPGIEKSQHEIRIDSVKFELTREPLRPGNFGESLTEMFRPPETVWYVLPDGHAYGEKIP